MNSNNAFSAGHPFSFGTDSHSLEVLVDLEVEGKGEQSRAECAVPSL